MSTKIYNGYKTNLSLNELHKVCLDLKKTITEKRDEVYKKLITTYALNTRAKLDAGLINFDDLKNSSPMSNALFEIRDRAKEIQKTQMRDPVVDFDCEFVFIPLEKYTLAMLYTEKKEFREIWENCGYFENYSYWNNTDPDESVSDEEWEQRGEDWDVLGYDAPSSVGMSFSCFGRFSTPFGVDKEDLTDEYIDSVFDRERMITLLLEDSISYAVAKEKGKWTFLGRRDREKWVSENPKKYEELKQNLEKIKSTYTVEDLYEHNR
jgi:hypothetical protein